MPQKFEVNAAKNKKRDNGGFEAKPQRKQKPPRSGNGNSGKESGRKNRKAQKINFEN